MAVEPIAERHAARQVALARETSIRLRQLWRLIDPQQIKTSWARLLPDVLAILGTSQATAAASAGNYVDDALDAQGAGSDAVGRINPAAFAGIASDGRPLASLLLEPTITALQQIKQGVTPAQALNSGQFVLDLIARTQIADAGRVAVGTAIAARPDVGGYVRMIVGKTCARCLILAGRRYRWNEGFRRHPRCDCRHVPFAEAVPDDVRTDPKAYFNSLDRAAQDELMGKAGAEAVREGADMARVVNARRGIQTADGRLYTTEAAGRRPRLMPEQIFRDASDRADAIRLLRLHGYITGTPPRAPVRTVTPAPAAVIRRPSSYAERAAAAASGQAALDAPRFGMSRRTDEFDPQMTRAVYTYTGAEYNAINRQLRGQRLPYGYEPADVLPTIADLDRAFTASRLERDVVVHRGVVDASPMFGDRLAGDLTGMQWREQAYLSTTANPRKAAGFAGTAPNAMVMRVVVPKGTPAVEASGMQVEAEVLLGRGRTLRVVADRGVSPDGVRHIDVEVLGD